MKQIFIIFMSYLSVSCYNKSCKCEDFKKGNFKFERKIDGEKKVTFFKRDDYMEIETYNGKTDTSTIHWLSNCEYVLTKLHPKKYSKQKPISIKILSTNKNSYIFEFGFVGNDRKQRGVAKKI